MPSSSTEQGVERIRRHYNPRGSILGRGKACNWCREKKLKCDGVTPKCGSCTAGDRDCAYVRIPKRTSNQSTSILESKLSTLEQRLAVLLDAPKSKSIKIPEAIREWRRLRQIPSQIEPPRDDSASPTSTAVQPPSPISTEFSVDDQSFLLEIFFKEGRRFAPFIKRERFYEQLASPDPAIQPHPALVNAILLNALGFINWYSLPVTLPPTIPSAEALVLRTQTELSIMLGSMDRLLDYLQASVFLINWFLHEGRLQEGHYTSALTARFAVACGLNKIPQALLQEDPAFYPFMAPGSSGWDTSLLGRPISRYEVGLRIGTFWKAYFFDKLYSTMAGLPCAFNDLKDGSGLITTPWPRIMAEYESGYAQIVHYSSIEDLFSPPPRLPEDHIPDIHLTSVLKALTLLHRSSKYVVTQRHEEVREEGRWLYDTIQNLRHAVTMFSDCLAANPMDTAVLNALLDGSGGLSEAEILGLDSSVLSLVQMMIQVTFINIHRSTEYLSSYSDEQHTQQHWHLMRLDSARKTITLARKLSAENLLERKVPFPYEMIGLLLIPVAFVLAEHANYMEDNPLSTCPVTLNDAKLDLGFAVGIITDQTRTFPLFGIQLSKISDLRQRGESWDRRALALLTS